MKDYCAHIISFDFNKDILKYSWYLDDKIVFNSVNNKYLLNTDDLSVGEHYIQSDVSDGDTTISATWIINILLPTETVENESSSITFSLKQNYPNPFSLTTKIDFEIPFNSHVILKVFNILGQEIKSLLNEQKAKGFYTIDWDGKNNNNVRVAQGTYICRIEISNGEKVLIQERKMIVVQ